VKSPAAIYIGHIAFYDHSLWATIWSNMGNKFPILDRVVQYGRPVQLLRTPIEPFQKTVFAMKILHNFAVI